MEKVVFKDMIMNHKTILFGSIGALVETSDLQRRAFNQAFSEAELHLDVKDCIAIEDSEISMQSALVAAIRCIGFPGANTHDNDFIGAVLVTDHLSVDDLTEL